MKCIEKGNLFEFGISMVAERPRKLAGHASVWNQCEKVICPEGTMAGRKRTKMRPLHRPFRTYSGYAGLPATLWLANFQSSSGAKTQNGL
jgi:hypothetical protein